MANAAVAGLAVPTRHGLCDAGAYYIATTPTPGTAFAQDIKTAFSDIVPWLYMGNSGTQQSNKSIHLDYIKLIVTVAAASATATRFAAVLDTAARALTTDNTTSLVIASPNTFNTVASVASPVKFQSSGTASAIAASSASKRISGQASLGGITVVGDELVLLFGGAGDFASSGLTAAQATTPGRKVSNLPPIIIPPGGSLSVHHWSPGNAVTGPSYEIEMGWWEY